MVVQVMLVIITARVGSSSGVVVAQIEVGFSQTLMCIYTVPAGYTAYLMAVDFLRTEE
jgi:hypothetical protein